jgi:hypothetical protein
MYTPYDKWAPPTKSTASTARERTMDTKIIVALIGAAGAIAAAAASVVLKRQNDTGSVESTAAGFPTNQVSATGNITDNVIGSTGVVIDRSQFSMTVAAPERRAASLSIVDVSTRTDQDACVLEIKVRNASDEVVFLKRAEIAVLGQWDIPRIAAPSAVPVSWTYDAEISSGRASVHLSQAIKPNDVDRFEIRVGSNSVEGKYPFMGLFLHLVRLKLFYNEDDLAVECPTLLLHIPCPMEVMAFTTFPARRGPVARNRARAQEVLNAIDKATIVEPRLLEAIRSWADVDLSKIPA